MRKTRLKQSKSAVLPLGIKNKLKTELPALVALTAIGQSWFTAQHQSDLLAVALVVREMALPGSLQADCAAELQRLCEQEITMENKTNIALNLAECLPWLQVQQNHLVANAIQALAAKAYYAMAA
ncbi:MAG: hypothetical protein Q8M20_06915 [Rhodocyclaceae bacterium]|nr:hypothetical protein [Rhodocyclaceae bacterium]MDZ4214368.1 hypothetical protein [Rhodocyclaceae bacterium]